MKNDINYDDKVSLPYLTALTRMKVSNKAKDIKKNDSAFELHDQYLAVVQTSYLVNLFDNYMEENEKMLDDVSSTESALKFVHEMLDAFDIQFYYDPTRPVSEKKKGEKEEKEEKEEGEQEEGEDDMFVYCKWGGGGLVEERGSS